VLNKLLKKYLHGHRLLDATVALIAQKFHLMELPVITITDFPMLMMTLLTGKLELEQLKTTSMFNLSNSGHQSPDAMVEPIALLCLMMELPVTMITDFHMLMMTLLTGRLEPEPLKTISMFNLMNKWNTDPQPNALTQFTETQSPVTPMISLITLSYPRMRTT
jgi:hypothetical protein